MRNTANSSEHPVPSLAALRWVVFVLTLAAWIYVGIHHEPWRDEADAWLAARDASLWQLLKSASYSGTPILWYLFVIPLARSGLPYESLEILAILLGSIAAWLLLFRLRLPLAISVLGLTGYHLGYEYSVVARNYGLGVVLFFMAVALDDRRDSAALRYGVLLALLANTGAHFLVLSGALFVAWIYREPPAHLRRRAVWVALLGMTASIIQLFPRAGGQLPPTFISQCSTQVAPLVLESIFGPPVWNLLQENANLALVILVFLATLATPRVTVFLAFAVAGLSYIFACKYFSGARHSGLILIAILGAFSLARTSPCVLRDPSPRLRTIMSGTVWLTWALFAFCLLLSLDATVLAVKKELRLPYSSAKEMGRYLERAAIGSKPIAAHPPPHTSSVLPYLARPTFYYPGINSWGSFMLWNDQYSNSRWLSNRDAFSRAKEFFSSQQSPSESFFFLTSNPFAEAEMFGYRLLFKTPGRPIQGDETFYVYGPGEADSGS